MLDQRGRLILVCLLTNIIAVVSLHHFPFLPLERSVWLILASIAQNLHCRTGKRGVSGKLLKRFPLNGRGEMEHFSAGKYGVTLETIARAAGLLQPVSRARVQTGDSIIVVTCNSVYFLLAQEDGSFLASGGWFSQTADSPQRVRINGCTWGGSAIKTDVVAAVGLNLEFGNRVVTSAIQRIFFFPRGYDN